MDKTISLSLYKEKSKFLYGFLATCSIFLSAFHISSYAANVLEITEYSVQKSDGSTQNKAAIVDARSGREHGGAGGGTSQGTGARRWHTDGETIHPLCILSIGNP